MRVNRGLIISGVIAISSWTLFVGKSIAQDGGSTFGAGTLYFDQTTFGEVLLATDRALESWIDSSLHERLGLDANNTLDLEPSSRFLNDYQIRSIQQSYMGIPVDGRKSRVVLNSQGDFIAYAGKHASYTESVPTTVSISYQDAIRLSELSNVGSMPDSAVLIEDAQGTLHLSWKATGTASANHFLSTEMFYLSVSNGEIVRRFPLIYTALDRRIIDFAGACRAENVNALVDAKGANYLMNESFQNYYRSEGQSTSGVGHVDRVYALFAQVYNFMEAVLDRDSLDDAGTTLQAVTGVRFHESVPWPQCLGNVFNAFWSDTAKSIFLPNIALPYTEVIAHELAHGIISEGSELVYERESGALNEALADAIGVSFRAWLESGGSASSSPTTINVFPGMWELRSDTATIRHMRNPRSVPTYDSFEYPDHYDNFVDLPNTKDGDWGGVHVNSSIINQSFYLLVAGGRHPRRGTGPPVNGIGVEKAVRIFTAAAATLLGEFDDFSDARVKFALAAELLHGKHSVEWIAVHEAMDAVGLPGNWQRNPPLAPTPLPAPAPAPTLPAPIPDTSQPSNTPAPSSSSSIPELPTQSASAPNGPGLLFYLVPIGLFLFAALWLLNRTRPGYGAELAGTDSAFRTTGTDTSGAPYLGSSFSSSLHASSHSKNRKQEATIGQLKPLNNDQGLPLIKRLLISPEGLVIGRANTLSHIILEDPHVSRRHLRLRLLADVLYVQDLNSTQRTSIDGKAIEPYAMEKIEENQLVRIAGISYVLELKENQQ